MTERELSPAIVGRRELLPLLHVRALAPGPAESSVRFPVAHPYVERCWLPLIGPSATWCLRRLDSELGAIRDGVVIDVATLAGDLGLASARGGSARLARTIERLCDFGLARFSVDQALEIRRSVPPLSPRAITRLSPEAQLAHREMVTERANPFLSAALSYARRGLSVLPLRVKDKQPDGRLVPHGLTEATSDQARIRSWWSASPQANVGIRTGSGIDVVDLDSPTARHALESLAPEPLSPSVVVRTARGWHLWFASCGLPTRAGVLEGVDVRGAGGYVVAPPSRHPDGHTYAFLDEQSGELVGELPDRHLAPAPPWLIDRLRPAPAPRPVANGPVRLRSSHYVEVAVESECHALAATAEGSRNDRLNRAAFSLGTLVGAKVLDAGRARAQLLEAALSSGLEEREAQRTIASGLAAGEKKPRQVAEGLPAAVASVSKEDRGQRETERRPPDPSRRPDEAATDAVLARARRTTTQTAPRPITPTTTTRRLGR